MKIADRIITALMAFAVIPVALFTPVIHWLYQLTFVGVLDSVLGNSISGISDDQGWTEDYVSIRWLYDRIRNMNIDLKNISVSTDNEKVAAIMTLVKVAAVFFVIAVVIAIVIGIVSIVSNAKKTQIVLSLFGVASLIVCMVCFNRFAAPLISGDITLGSFLDIWWVSYITKLGSLNLSSAWFYMMGLFIAIILWSISYIVTLPPDKAEKYKLTFKRKGKNV